MTDKDLRAKAIALYDRFTHEHRDRRAFMRELTLLAGGATAANALLAGIAANPAVASIVPPDDARLKTQTLTWESGKDRRMSGYAAAPAGTNERLPIVIVIHENRGLNEHTRDVARRFALEGFSAVAPDFLTPVGGTPADEDRAREMIGALDLAASVQDGKAIVEWLSSLRGGARKVGVVGYCWGGAMVNRIAVATGATLKGGVVYYGTAPDPAEADKVKAPLMIHLAGLDERVNKSALPWAAALEAAGKDVRLHEYPGVNHAFNNDTSAERYDADAARLAWDRTVGFFNEVLV